MADPSAPVESLIDEREEVMVQLNGGNSTLRKAYFLKPTFTFNSDHLLPPPPSLLFSKPTFNQLKKPRLWIYKGHPALKWKTWVHNLKPKFQEIWKEAGIYEAILASTYKIPRDKNLILGLAERWSGETNTFIFPWGEVTITLEDVINLGNYSVLGASFSTPLTKELTDVLNCMKKIHKDAKLSGGRNVNADMWMNYFMGSDQFEHEAFLALWLSKFVLIQSQDYIAIHHFCVAIHLSRGTRIALAPVVLASIYRDMRLLHNSMVQSSKLDDNDGIRGIGHAELVLMWAWERIPDLRPNPNVIKGGDPRSSQWNGVKTLKVKDTWAALDSAYMSFLWRPYAVSSSNSMFSKLYRDNEQWVAVGSDEIESYSRCLRMSELVGLGCIEQHLPHRVAMQFGFDQDIPPHVIRSNEGPETAWSKYNRPIRDVKLYIPPRIFDSAVSSRYVDWWRGLVPLKNQDATRLPLRDSVLLATPGCASKCLRETPVDNVKKGSLTSEQLLNGLRKRGRYRNDPEPAFGMRTEYMCMAEHVELSMPSHEKCKKGKYSTEKQIESAENAIMSQVHDTGANIVDTEEESREKTTSDVPQLEPETHILRLEEVNIVDTEEERFNKNTSEVPQMELKTRVLCLELIVNMIKTTKLVSSSKDKF